MKHGSYRRARDPQRRIPRFQCPTCRRTFSREAFSTAYRLRRPRILRPVAGLLVSGCAHRQIARHLDCSHSTVGRLAVRLGRHAELFHEYSMQGLERIQETVVLDHFETFVRSQVERLGIGTAVGQRSWFVYGLGGARYRSATRRSRRKRALKRAPRPTPVGAVVTSTQQILESLRRKAPNGLDLVSDDHPAYRAAIRRLDTALPPIRHRIFPNPDRSPGHDVAVAHRRDREMFAVDLTHKLIRHSQAHHRRETIAFGRKSSNVLGRMALFAVWRNFIKRVTERRPTTLTPAMKIGLATRRWTWREVLAERLFEGRLSAESV